MNRQLERIERDVYSQIGFCISELQNNTESRDYDACTFKLNELRIISRSSKTTPTKTGQFVTFWKRLKYGPIAPFDASDDFDFLVVNAENGQHFGQFVFPKSVLISKGIIASITKKGKRAFRVYPIWDAAKSKQAINSQKWQLNYFYAISSPFSFKNVTSLYQNQ